MTIIKYEDINPKPSQKCDVENGERLHTSHAMTSESVQKPLLSPRPVCMQYYNSKVKADIARGLFATSTRTVCMNPE